MAPRGQPGNGLNRSVMSMTPDFRRMWVTTRIESDSISQAQVADSYDLATDCPFRVNASSRAPPVAEDGFLAAENTATFGRAASTDYRATFFAANQELEGQVVFHYAVEQQTMTKFPRVGSEVEIHSLENLRGIPKAISSEVQLSQIRIEWNSFHRSYEASGTVPTRAQLLQKAAEIDAKYGSQFAPPVGGGK